MYRILGSWIKPREYAKVGLVPWNIHLLVMTARNGFRFHFFPKPLHHSVKLNFDWSTIKRSTEKPPLESHHYPSNLNLAQVHLGACGHDYKPLVESSDYQWLLLLLLLFLYLFHYNSALNEQNVGVRRITRLKHSARVMACHGVRCDFE